MAYAKINPTGCTERYGLIQVRLDLFLESGDVRYDDPRFYVIDTTSKKYVLGFTGKLDKEGQPRDPEAYAAWEASLPRVWLPERCFHHHFIYLDPYTLRDEQITEAIARHLPNFYAAWVAEWDLVAGGMRHGWDVATRIRPVRFNLTQPELYVARRAECLTKVDILKVYPFATQVKGTGETCPSTDIDVGTPAQNFTNSWATTAYTVINLNNPANDTGALDYVELWLASGSATAMWAGTFSLSGSTYTCRDSANLGAAASGSKQAYTGLDIDIAAGDFIGMHAKSGTDNAPVERTSSGYGGYGAINGENIDQGDSGAFNFYYNDDAISLYGTGDTGGWGNIAKVGGITATDLAKIDGVAVADIAKINGVAV